MVSLSWGNVLAILLPGMVSLIALRNFNPTVNALLADPNKLELQGAVYLLLLAALLGGIIEGVRTITVDNLTGSRGPQSGGNVYEYLTPENLSVFQAGVDNSFKYYCFYGNLGLATAMLMIARIIGSAWGVFDFWLFGVVLVCALAGWTQYAMFIGFLQGFMKSECERRRHAAELSQTGKTGSDAH